MKIYSKFEKISKIEKKLQLRKKYENFEYIFIDPF